MVGEVIGLGRPLRSRLHTSGTRLHASLRYNQLRRLRTCTYLLRKALALSSSLAVRRVTRLQQVLLVTCCASKRHRCLILSIIPSSHPIPSSSLSPSTSSHHHITPLPRILVCVYCTVLYMGTRTRILPRILIPPIDPCTSPASLRSTSYNPYIPSIHTSTHASRTCMYVPAQHHSKRPPPKNPSRKPPRFFFPLPSGRSWAG
jgi:hypothetical protein